ncbi:MAG: hypothetical protein J07HX64_01728 [halophilic archaeon J07HX64]|nr:MAG: hypothetical protein J07HX64_01728 [halophilic archaeon J07HX64]
MIEGTDQSEFETRLVTLVAVFVFPGITDRLTGNLVSLGLVTLLWVLLSIT